MQHLSTVVSYGRVAFEHVQTACVSMYNHAQPIIETVADKIQDVWTASKPALQALAEFSATRIGAAAELMGFSIIPLIISRHISNTYVKVAFVALGIIALGAGLYLGIGLPLPFGLFANSHGLFL